ncbi:unnamed protein product [Coregonus sp. 'balchen']|nr:unnamed protein product [Coregonus sp. 'balchen']
MATLHCRAEGPLVEYRWSWPDHQGEMWSQEQTGQHYNIKSPESDSYTCEARNPVSEKTQTYNSNDCLATGNPYIYIGIGAGVLLLVSVVVVVVVWLIKKHSKDLRSTGNGSHLEEDREKVVAISQAEIVEEENKLLQDEELTLSTSVNDRVNRINQTSGEGKGEKKPLLDKAGSTDTDVIESNSPFKLNNQNQVLGWESGKRQREEKEQSAESKQNMNVTLGTVTEGSGPTAPSKPPRSSLNFNSPYPQTLETQHSREHHGGGPDQSMGGYGTEREGAGDGEGDGQLMSQKVLVLDTREESGGKEAGTREDREDEEKEEVVGDDLVTGEGEGQEETERREDEEKEEVVGDDLVTEEGEGQEETDRRDDEEVVGDDLVTEEGEGQEETDRRDDGGEREGKERETEENEEEQEEGEGEERGKKEEETQKGGKREEGKSPTSPKQTLPRKAPRPPLAPKPSSIRRSHGCQMGGEQGRVVKMMETQRSSGQVDREGRTPGLSGLRRPTSSVSDSTDTPDRSSPGLSAVPIATAFSPQAGSGTLSNPGKSNLGAPSGPMWSQEQTGQHYNIKSPESDSYTCEARNPVSEKTQTYNSNDCLATDLRSTGNGSHLEEDREKVVAISQAEIVEEENKLLQDEELTLSTSVNDRVNRINQTSGEGKGEKKPLLDKAGSTDTDVIESNSPFKLNNQNQVLGWESGKRQREEKEQSAESKQNMNVTLGTVTEGSGPTAPSKPPRSSLNFNSPYPQTLETQHSREHHGGGPDQSMGGYGTEREGAGDGEGDGQLMSQKVLVLDTREESGGKEAGTREDREDEEKEEVVGDDLVTGEGEGQEETERREDEEKEEVVGDDLVTEEGEGQEETDRRDDEEVVGDDLVTEEGEGQEETDRRDDGGEREGKERETEENEEEQEEGEGEERGKKEEETQKGGKREEGKSPTSPKQTLPRKAPRPPLAPKPSSIRRSHGCQMGGEQGRVVKMMETQRSSGQVDREGRTPGLSGLRRPTSSVSDSTDTPDRSSPGLSAVPIATAFSPQAGSGTLSNPGKSNLGAPSGPRKVYQQIPVKLQPLYQVKPAEKHLLK